MDPNFEERRHTFEDEGSSWHPALRPHNDDSTIPSTTAAVTDSSHEGTVSEQSPPVAQTTEDISGDQQVHEDAGAAQQGIIGQTSLEDPEALQLPDRSASVPTDSSANRDGVPQESASTFADFLTGQETSIAHEESRKELNDLEDDNLDDSPVERRETPPLIDPSSQSMADNDLEASERQHDVPSEQTGQDELGAQGQDVAMVESVVPDVDMEEPSHVDYEHQGDTTEVDAAVDEAPTASLLEHEDPEDAAGFDVEATDEIPMSIEEEPATAMDQVSEPAHEPAPFETAGPSEAEHTADAFDWGTTDDNDFTNELGLSAPQQTDPFADAAHFGTEIAKNSGFPEVPTTTDPDGQDSTTAQDAAVDAVDGTKEEDLAALWAAALAGDDFLDDTKAVDPSSFFPDDDGGFLDEEPFPPAAPTTSSATPAPAKTASNSGADRYTPAIQSQPQPYTSRNNSFYDQSYNPRTASTPSTGLPAAFPQPASNASLRPAGPQASRSFVDRAKQGYSSPYDLPMDIVQPRKRAAAPVTPAAPPNLPPPRTSSIPPPTAPPAQARGPPSASGPAGLTSPPQPSGVANPTTSATSAPGSKAPSGAVQKSGSGFFEDLPMTVKPRQRPSGAFTPNPSVATTGPPQGPPSRPPSRPVGTSASVPPAAALGGLRQPERLPLLPDQQAAMQSRQPSYQPQTPGVAGLSSPPLASPLAPSASASAARYSPAPVQTAAGSIPTSNRYSPAPGAQPFPPKVQAFIPKTSSPLAYHEELADRQPSISSVQNVDYSQQGPTIQMPPSQPALVRSTSYAPSNAPARMTTPLQGSTSPQMVQRSPQSDRYAPTTAPADMIQSPPKRSKTQSPSLVMKQTAQKFPALDRSFSATGLSAYQAAAPSQSSSGLALPPAQRQFSADLSFAVPQDERSADPLERWKGCPILHWSPSGALVSSFPKQAPFYAAGHGIPSIKCTPGPVTVHDTKLTLPLSEQDTKFPGPLNGKGKGKKKDVVSWLTSKIESIEKLAESTQLDLSMNPQLKKRTEEKVILWKVVKLLVENDNSLEKSSLEGQMRQILLPSFDPAQAPASSSVGGNTEVPAEFVTPESLAVIKRHLLEGQREKAVWFAAEKKMWAHAMLIASTLGPQVWKQVSSEFVKAQVMNVSGDTQSLAALYDVFAGNSEECVDELVPPSARAGFQMISKRSSMGSSARNPLDGLDQWRETLALIVSNRSSTDVAAIAALGRLLSSYGRIEAAHTCFLFARSAISYSGADNAEASFVLLGADHKSQATGLGSDLDAIMLTEVYEYALSLAPAPGTSPIIPHLQAFKLIHAYELAEHGLRSEAQAYCDAIFTAVKSSTRGSPYYHGAFTSAVDDLNRCLSQAPQTGSSSTWVSKLSSEKVSGSMWKRFNNFVAGEEGDPANASGITNGAGTAGPFGGITGETPTVSRAASSTDLYGAMAGGAYGTPTIGGSSSPYAPSNYGSVRASPQQTQGSRYAPSGGGYTPRASLESTRSQEADRLTTGYAPQPAIQRAASTPYGAYLPQSQTRQKPAQAGASLYTPRPDASRAASDYRVPYSREASRQASLDDSYRPQPEGQATQLPPVESSYTPQPPLQQTTEDPNSPYAPPTSSFEPPAAAYEGESSFETPQASYEPPIQSIEEEFQGQEEEAQASYEPPAASYEPPSASYEPPSASYEPPSTSYEPPSNSYEPPTSSYEPPSSSYEPPSSSYEPPSSLYEPYQPSYDNEAPEVADDEPKPKKKSFMDLDDDEPMFAPKQQEISKAEARAQADREANEAVRKAAEADAARDKAEKEAAAKKGWFGGWFGKKEGDEAPKAVRAKLGEQSSFYFDKDLNKWVNKKGGTEETTASPTPPPPKGVASRAVSGAGGPPSGPPSRVVSGLGGPPPMSRPGTAGPPGSGPPSRGGTPGGDANGTPPLPSGAMPPPSRPATNLSQASSIDDLLGAAGPRKGGASGPKGKKKGRYVDVMAKP
ncbi:hypothetical protein MBLNU457_7116t1 [Dothideomycetes sp. NU457]